MSKSTFWALIFNLLVLLVALASAAEPVRSIQVADVGGQQAFTCFGHAWANDGDITRNLAKRNWQNNEGRTLKIFGFSATMGMDYGARADLLAVLFKTPSMEIITDEIIWDHYQDPAAPTTFQYPVPGGNYIEILPGEGIETWVACNPFVTSKDKNQAKAMQTWLAFVSIRATVSK